MNVKAGVVPVEVEFSGPLEGTVDPPESPVERPFMLGLVHLSPRASLSVLHALEDFYDEYPGLKDSHKDIIVTFEVVDDEVLAELGIERASFS
jgi:hypothetical protein